MQLQSMYLLSGPGIPSSPKPAMMGPKPIPIPSKPRPNTPPGGSWNPQNPHPDKSDPIVESVLELSEDKLEIEQLSIPSKEDAGIARFIVDIIHFLAVIESEKGEDDEHGHEVGGQVLPPKPPPRPPTPYPPKPKPDFPTVETGGKKPLRPKPPPGPGPPPDYPPPPLPTNKCFFKREGDVCTWEAAFIKSPVAPQTKLRTKPSLEDQRWVSQSDHTVSAPRPLKHPKLPTNPNPEHQPPHLRNSKPEFGFRAWRFSMNGNNMPNKPSMRDVFAHPRIMLPKYNAGPTPGTRKCEISEVTASSNMVPEQTYSMLSSSSSTTSKEHTGEEGKKSTNDVPNPDPPKTSPIRSCPSASSSPVPIPSSSPSPSSPSSPPPESFPITSTSSPPMPSEPTVSSLSRTGSPDIEEMLNGRTRISLDTSARTTSSSTSQSSSSATSPTGFNYRAMSSEEFLAVVRERRDIAIKNMEIAYAAERAKAEQANSGGK